MGAARDSAGRGTQRSLRKSDRSNLGAAGPGDHHGPSAGTAALAREVYDELTELGINQLATSARVIEHWSNAMGPGGYDTADAVREAIDKHTEDGTPDLSADVLPVTRRYQKWPKADPGAASAALDCAESIAAATGERVWDEQRAARRLRLRAAASSRRDGGLRRRHRWLWPRMSASASLENAFSCRT